MKKDMDIKLYNSYLKGEKEAFEILYNKYKNNILYFIFNIVKDYQKAEDITQEVFIYVLQNKIKERYNFKCYIYLVAKSKALNYINLEKRRNNIINQYFTKEEQVEKDVLEVITKEESKKDLLKSINLLNDKYKNAIYLVNIEELSYKETAEILGVSLSDVKNTIHRGKKELRKILAKEGYDEMNKILKVFIIIIGVTVCLSGVVFAGVKIYNEYIKKQNEITSRGLFDTGNGITTYETDLMANDMTWNKECRLYHKIITNIEEYYKYKSRIDELPNMQQEDFKDNFLVIIANENIRQMHEKDLIIQEVNADDQTTHIIMKQKENPDYNKENNIWYAIVDRSQLRENADVEIKNRDENTDGFINIKEIPDNYSIEQAIKDGCFVLEKNKVISNDKELIDKFIEKIKNEKNGFIRVYIKYNNDLQIKDVKYEDDIYYLCTRSTIIGDSQSKKYYYNSYKQLKRREGNKTYKMQYVFYNEEDPNSGTPLLIIQ